MAYIPYAPETGCKYYLQGPGGTLATFNDTSDPNWVGTLTDVTGLDSPLVREAADDLVQTDGGWHGNFWYGRRPITLSGTVYGHADANARATKLDLLRQASNAMRQDASLYWQPSVTGAPMMYAPVRRQQPLRITGAWNKDFQVLLVCQFAPLFSFVTNTQSGVNLYGNTSFESNITSMTAANGAVAQTTAQAFDGTHSLQVTANGSGVNSVYRNSGFPWDYAATPNTTYTASCYVRANTTSRSWAVRMVYYNSGGAQIGSTTGTYTADSNAAWTRISLTDTTPVGTAGMLVQFVSNTTPANGEIHYFDAVQLNEGSALLTFSNTFSGFTVENQGDYPSYPTLRIYGPIVNPVITNVTNGTVVSFLAGYPIGAGHYVDVDTLNHTATLDGTTDQTGFLDFVNSTWTTIVTGVNTFTLGGTGTSAGYGLRASWRSAWI